MRGVMGRAPLTIVVLMLAAVGLIAVVATPAPALATSAYADATGQRCPVCHVGQPAQAVLTEQGQRFAAVPGHRTDPAGAWAMVAGQAPASPVPVPAQLPRTGESSSPTLPGWTVIVGLALVLAGGLLVARSRRVTD